MIARRHSVILGVMSEVLIPILLLYAMYVLFHGHYSPGGGFQAGVILSAALLLRILARGRAARPISYITCLQLGALGVGIYAGIGVAAMIGGSFFLDYAAVPLAAADHPEMRRSFGILGIETGVCLGVMALTLAIYYALASVDPRELEGEG